MDIVLCHWTAFRFWRAFTGRRRDLPVSKVASAPATPCRITAQILGELANLGITPTADNPVDLLYGSLEARSQSRLVNAHVTAGALPVGSLVRLAPHVLIESPERCLAHLARTSTLLRAILRGAEMCGSYALVGPELTLVSREPLTSADRIKAYLAACGPYEAGRVARQAARYIPDGAASPQEARVALLLSLPATLGGYGLPAPVLNHPLELGEAARGLYPHRQCRLDLYWPAISFDLEYDGREAHELRGAEDMARAVALQVEGVEVLSLTREQVADADAFDAVARLVAGKLGRRLRVRCSDWGLRRDELRAACGLEAYRD